MLSPAPYFMKASVRSPRPKTEQTGEPEMKMATKPTLTKNNQSLDKDANEVEIMTTPTKSSNGLRKSAQGMKNDHASLMTYPSSLKARPRRKSVTFSTLLNNVPSPKAKESDSQTIPTRPTRDEPTGRLPSVETMTSSDTRSVSGDSSSTVRRVSNETKAVTNGASNRVRNPSSESTASTTISKTISNKTTPTLRAVSSESKPVSKVKALAQAFNNLAGPNGPVRRRASVKGHKRGGIWTEKLRRSMNMTTKEKNGVEQQHLVATNEEIEPASPVMEEHKDDLGEVKIKHGKEEEEKEVEVQLANSPPESPSIPATNHPEFASTIPGPKGEIQLAASPLDSLPMASATTLPTPPKDDLQLANSPPTDSPDMVATETAPNTHTTSFLGPRLNHKSSSIYSQSQSGDSPQKTPTPAPLSIAKHPSLTSFDSPTKKPPHKRSGTNTPTHRKTSTGVDYSAYLAEDYTTYLDQNFLVGTPPPILERNPARLQQAKMGNGPQSLIQASLRDEACTLSEPLPRTPNPKSINNPTSLSQGLKNGGSNNHVLNNADTLNIVYGDITNQQRAVLLHGTALRRLKREARNLGRLGESAAMGLVGNEIWAGEERGDDGFWM